MSTRKTYQPITPLDDDDVNDNNDSNSNNGANRNTFHSKGTSPQKVGEVGDYLNTQDNRSFGSDGVYIDDVDLDLDHDHDSPHKNNNNNVNSNLQTSSSYKSDGSGAGGAITRDTAESQSPDATPDNLTSLSSSFDFLDDEDDDEANISRYNLGFTTLDPSTSSCSGSALSTPKGSYHYDGSNHGAATGGRRGRGRGAQGYTSLQEQGQTPLASSSFHNDEDSDHDHDINLEFDISDINETHFATPGHNTGYRTNNRMTPPSAGEIWHSFQSMRTKARQRRAQRLLTMSSETFTEKLQYWFYTWCWDATDRAMMLLTILVLTWVVGFIAFYKMIGFDSDSQFSHNFVNIWCWGFGTFLIIRIFGRWWYEYCQEQRRNRRVRRRLNSETMSMSDNIHHSNTNISDDRHHHRKHDDFRDEPPLSAAAAVTVADANADFASPSSNVGIEMQSREMDDNIIHHNIRVKSYSDDEDDLSV